MSKPLVFTFVGTDKPGLVEKLSQTVAAHGGNWLESRMSELAGQFAGLVKVEVGKDRVDALRAGLMALCEPHFSVVVAESAGEPAASSNRQLRLTIVGNDRPGIMREVSHALAARNISVSEMDTSITSAPMSGDPLFEAAARIQVPQTLDLDELNAQLDTIANALTVHIDLEQSLR